MNTALTTNYMLTKYRTLSKKQRALISLGIYAIILLLLLFITANYAHAISGNRSYETYNHLIDGTFYYEDSNSAAAKRFQAIAASILRVVFPFMTVFALLVIVIKMSATIIYLSTPDYFDEVHYFHRVRRQRKFAGQSRGAMASFLSTIKESGMSGAGEGLLKGAIIPDMKALAFYDACEIGEDGRPSMSTFFKNSFPKYVVIIAMIIMINDQTMLTLYFRAAEVGVYFFQKATQIEMVGTIERFLNEGKNYDPGWKGAKKNVYKTIERQLLSVDKSEGTEKTEYKQAVGAKVANWMEQNMSDIDWNNYRVTCTASIDTVMMQQVPANTWQEDVQSTFGVRPGDGTKYLTVRINLENKNFWKPTAGEVRTTDPTAWNIAGSTLTLDMTKVSGVSKDAQGFVVNKSIPSPVGTAVQASVDKSGMAKFEIKDAKKFSHIFVDFTYMTSDGMRKSGQTVFVNPMVAGDQKPAKK